MLRWKKNIRPALNEYEEKINRQAQLLNKFCLAAKKSTDYLDPVLEEIKEESIHE